MGADRAHNRGRLKEGAKKPQPVINWTEHVLKYYLAVPQSR